jgi:hypothetical protein
MFQKPADLTSVLKVLKRGSPDFEEHKLNITLANTRARLRLLYTILLEYMDY